MSQSAMLFCLQLGLVEAFLVTLLADTVLTFKGGYSKAGDLQNGESCDLKVVMSCCLSDVQTLHLPQRGWLLYGS